MLLTQATPSGRAPGGVADPVCRPAARNASPGPPRSRALAHVAARSAGAPLDPRLRVTLNFRRKAAGAAPRFGSAHLRLAPATLPRTTFCYPDSVLESSDFGVASALALIELALADQPDDLQHRRGVQYAGRDVGPVRTTSTTAAIRIRRLRSAAPFRSMARRLRTAPSMMATLMARAMMVAWTM